MPRIFIAIKMPDAVIGKITEVSRYFQSQTPADALKWVETENLHLTLRFLGEISEETLKKVQSILPQAVMGQPSFTLSVEGLGMYPSPGQPRVVWLGIRGSQPMTTLHTQLEAVLAKAGIEKEDRPFHPHLTLARVRQRTDRATAHQIGETLTQFKVGSLGAFQVDEIHLIESQLTPQGPVYTARAIAPLSAV